MSRINKDIPKHTVPPDRMTEDLKRSASKIVSEKVMAALAATSGYFEVPIANDGDTYIEIPVDARVYFSTDARKSQAVVVVNGSEMPRSVFTFHSNGEAIVWSVANSGFILETIDLLILKAK